MARTKKTQNPPKTESYGHPTAESLLRPEIGTQAQFRKKKPPATYRYDPSLNPSMSWDEGQAAREEGDAMGPAGGFVYKRKQNRKGEERFGTTWPARRARLLSRGIPGELRSR